MSTRRSWRVVAFGIASLASTWACGGSEFGRAGSGTTDGGAETGGEPGGGAGRGSGGGSASGGSSAGGRASGSGGSAAGATGSGGAAGGNGSGGASGGAMGAGGTTGGGPGSGGLPGAGGGPGAGGQVGAGGTVSGTQCGGLIGTQCEGTEWCDYDDGFGECGAGDASGLCRPRPVVCDLSLQPVCACDGKYYSNPCMANAEGFDVSSDTSCFPGGGPGSHCNADGECQPGLQCCYPCGIPGCQNQCTVTAGAGCPLLP